MKKKQAMRQSRTRRVVARQIHRNEGGTGPDGSAAGKT